MFDIGIGFSELLLIAVVLIIVVGPEELPGVLRTIGRYVGQVRRMADDFRSQFDEVLREAELDKMKDEINSVGDSMAGVVESLDVPLGEDGIIDFEEHNRRILEEEQRQKAMGGGMGEMISPGAGNGSGSAEATGTERETGAGTGEGAKANREAAVSSGNGAGNDAAGGEGEAAGAEDRVGLAAGSGSGH